LCLLTDAHQLRFVLGVAVPGAGPAEIGHATYHAGAGDSVWQEGRTGDGVGST
jgi:hypothetical protein